MHLCNMNGKPKKKAFRAEKVWGGKLRGTNHSEDYFLRDNHSVNFAIVMIASAQLDNRI